jgi:hypothetical protein
MKSVPKNSFGLAHLARKLKNSGKNLERKFSIWNIIEIGPEVEHMPDSRPARMKNKAAKTGPLFLVPTWADFWSAKQPMFILIERPGVSFV